MTESFGRHDAVEIGHMVHHESDVSQGRCVIVHHDRLSHGLSGVKAGLLARQVPLLCSPSNSRCRRSHLDDVCLTGEIVAIVAIVRG